MRTGHDRAILERSRRGAAHARVTNRIPADSFAARLTQRAELEHVARVATLGELTATLTHELSQPRAAILTRSYVGVRLLDAPETDLQEVRSTLTEIHDVTEHAGEVVRGLRAMLKRDSTPASVTNVDVNHVIRIVERMAHGDANRHKVTLHLDLSSDIRPVKGDSVQAAAGHLEPAAQCLQRDERSRTRRRAAPGRAHEFD